MAKLLIVSLNCIYRVFALVLQGIIGYSSARNRSLKDVAEGKKLNKISLLSYYNGFLALTGEVTERLNVPVLKTGVG